MYIHTNSYKHSTKRTHIVIPHKYSRYPVNEGCCVEFHKLHSNLLSKGKGLISLYQAPCGLPRRADVCKNISLR